MIKVYADWQPGYMGQEIPQKQKFFVTIEAANPTIDEWKKTACSVVVSKIEETLIEKYVWGKKWKVKQ